MTESKSAVCEFLREQTVLVTGGTGFLGKALVEKLLRTCHPRQILLLVRNKKGVDSVQRLDNLFKDPVFDRLREEAPDFMKRVTGVDGDMSVPELGLSQESRQLIIDTVSVVIHGAATVRFDEKIKTAVDINVRGTKAVMSLCRQIKNLKSVVHVSTAYSYCTQREIDEVFYDPPIAPEALISMVDSLPEERLDKLTPMLLQGWPNTYSFTKAVAEDLVRTYGKDLPIAMFRPAIVVGAHEEPIKGWIDNLYGPTGVMVGVGAGVMRALYANSACKAELVPVDMCINALLTMVYDTSINQPNSSIKVYNYATSSQNPLTWGEFAEITMRWGKEVPSAQALWYYTLIMSNNWYVYQFLALVLHTLPGIFMDLILLLLNKKTRMRKVYNKLHKFSEVIAYFSTSQWKFYNKNVEMLMSNTSEVDRELFNFDMNTVDWDDFFRENVNAVRVYLFKEKTDSIPKAKSRMLWLYVLHRVTQVVLSVLFVWVVWALLGAMQRSDMITTHTPI